MGYLSHSVFFGSSAETLMKQSSDEICGESIVISVFCRSVDFGDASI